VQAKESAFVYIVMCTYLSTQREIAYVKIRVDCDSSCQCQLNILHIYHPVSYWEDIFRSCVQHILKPSLPCSFCIWAYISFTLSRLYIPFETCGCFQILMKFYKIHYQEVRILKYELDCQEKFIYVTLVVV
jgi:hypothetical protein